jgi:glycosyltransferase involved in cell wall biosynthesis
VSEHRRATVVFCSPYRSLGGSQTYLLSIASIVRETCDVEALMPASASPTLQRYWRERGVRMRFLGVALDEDPRPRWRERLRRRVRKWRVDAAIWRAVRGCDASRTILHLDLAPWTFFWLIAWFVRVRRFPVVITLHTGLPPVRGWRRIAWRAKLRYLDSCARFQIIVASRHVLDSLTPFLPAARIECIPVAYSPADVPDLTATATAAEPPALAGTRASVEARSLAESQASVATACEVVTVAQFIERKGPWILLAAARQLVVEQRADVRFVWICGTPPSESDRKRITSFGLGDRFVCIPADTLGDTRAALYARMRAATMFVLPSLEEGLPLALVEAMALGLPVIATRINGIPEAITPDSDGILIAPHDANALAAAIDRLQRDRDLRVRLGAAACTRARTQFDPRRTAATTLAVYDRLHDIA